MYIVEIQNGNDRKQIHGLFQKLTSGKVTQGINAIDSFVFTIHPNNAGFPLIHDFMTLVTVYNTNTGAYEFQGRALYTSLEMTDSGMISKQVTCESFFGYLCDSVQTYVAEKNWKVRDLLNHIIQTHNSMVEPEKAFYVRKVTVEDKNDNLYVGIQRENTWETIKKKLLEVLGGEISFEVTEDGIAIDYVTRIGEDKTTEIALSKNMKAITRERDPSDCITRLIPLGAKIDEDTEERYTIASVNNKKEYIDHKEAIAQYGIHVGIVTWDDVHEPSILYDKGVAWLEENGKVPVSYSVTALDLFLLGYAFDSFKIGNSHPLKNSMLGIDDKGRIVKRTIDVCEEIKSTFEIGDKFKPASEIQKDQQTKLDQTIENIKDIQSDYVGKGSMKEYATQDWVKDFVEDLLEEKGFVTEEEVKDIVKEETGDTGGSGEGGDSGGSGEGTGEIKVLQINCEQLMTDGFYTADNVAIESSDQNTGTFPLRISTTTGLVKVEITLDAPIASSCTSAYGTINPVDDYSFYVEYTGGTKNDVISCPESNRNTGIVSMTVTAMK